MLSGPWRPSTTRSVPRAVGGLVVTRRPDDEEWFDRRWRAIEDACPDVHRAQRDIDWGRSLAIGDLFDVAERTTFAWCRTP